LPLSACRILRYLFSFNDFMALNSILAMLGTNGFEFCNTEIGHCIVSYYLLLTKLDFRRLYVLLLLTEVVQ
jgi:hypothetical protein